MKYGSIFILLHVDIHLSQHPFLIVTDFCEFLSILPRSFFVLEEILSFTVYTHQLSFGKARESLQGEVN